MTQDERTPNVRMETRDPEHGSPGEENDKEASEAAGRSESEDDAEAEALAGGPSATPPPPVAKPGAAETAPREPEGDLDGGFMATVGADVLRAWLDPIRALADEGCVEITREGFRVATVDPAHVAMVRATLERSAFEHLEVRTPEDPKCGGVVRIGVDLTKVSDALCNVPYHDLTVRLWTKGPHLYFRAGPLTRRMRLLDTSGFVEPRVPDVKLSVRVVARADDLKLGIRGADGVSDHVAFVAEPGVFRVTGGDEGDEATLELYAEDGDVTVEGAGDGPVRSLFPLDYLSKVLREVWAEEVEIRFGRDFPVKLTWTPTVLRPPETTIRVGTCEILVAPRMESD